jgi:hypothetical protein
MAGEVWGFEIMHKRIIFHQENNSFMHLKVPGLFFIITVLSITSFSQSDKDSIQTERLYKQLYAVKYKMWALAVSGEYLLRKDNLTLNIEPTVSLFPVLSSFFKPVSGLDLLFPDHPYLSATIEPVYYFTRKKQFRENNAYVSFSLPATYYFTEKYIKDTTYHGISVIPKFTLKDAISKRVNFQFGLGYGIAFIRNNYRQTTNEGILGFDIKINYMILKRRNT